RREADLRLVAEERLRIARELHDVVSHTIATIGIQAGVAAHVLDREPGHAREALAAIKTSARDAMHDLRGMMGVLRQDAGTAPAPGLSSLPELLERVRAAGVAVELDVRGTSRALTPATDLAAYRVVQEALTNVIRHAPGASARISVDYAPDQLRIEVTDSGGTAVAVAAAAGAGAGPGGDRGGQREGGPGGGRPARTRGPGG